MELLYIIASAFGVGALTFTGKEIWKIRKARKLKKNDSQRVMIMREELMSADDIEKKLSKGFCEKSSAEKITVRPAMTPDQYLAGVLKATPAGEKHVFLANGSGKSAVAPLIVTFDEEQRINTKAEAIIEQMEGRAGRPESPTTISPLDGLLKTLPKTGITCHKIPSNPREFLDPAIQSHCEHLKRVKESKPKFPEDYLRLTGDNWVIRILPSDGYGRKEYVVRRQHYMKNEAGENQGFECTKRQGKDDQWHGECPICDYRKHLLASASIERKKNHIKADKMEKLASEIKGMERYYYNVLDMSKVDYKETTIDVFNMRPQILSVGVMLHEEIQNLKTNGIDLISAISGHNIRIRRQMNYRPLYTVTPIRTATTLKGMTHILSKVWNLETVTQNWQQTHDQLALVMKTAGLKPLTKCTECNKCMFDEPVFTSIDKDGLCKKCSENSTCKQCGKTHKITPENKNAKFCNTKCLNSFVLQKAFSHYNVCGTCGEENIRTTGRIGFAGYIDSKCIGKPVCFIANSPYSESKCAADVRFFEKEVPAPTTVDVMCRGCSEIIPKDSFNKGVRYHSHKCMENHKRDQRHTSCCPQCGEKEITPDGRQYKCGFYQHDSVDFQRCSHFPDCKCSIAEINKDKRGCKCGAKTTIVPEGKTCKGCRKLIPQVLVDQGVIFHSRECMNKTLKGYSGCPQCTETETAIIDGAHSFKCGFYCEKRSDPKSRFNRCKNLPKCKCTMEEIRNPKTGIKFVVGCKCGVKSTICADEVMTCKTCSKPIAEQAWLEGTRLCSKECYETSMYCLGAACHLCGTGEVVHSCWACGADGRNKTTCKHFKECVCSDSTIYGHKAKGCQCGCKTTYYLQPQKAETVSLADEDFLRELSRTDEDFLEELKKLDNVVSIMPISMQLEELKKLDNVVSITSATEPMPVSVSSMEWPAQQRHFPHHSG